MAPQRQMAIGIDGCVLVAGSGAYKLADGTLTTKVAAVPLTLMFAESSLRKQSEGSPIRCEAAAALGYTIVRSYSDAVAYGLV
jgi:hypothetical protein